MISIKDQKCEYKFFKSPAGVRLDLSISRCGYLTVSEGPSCIYKNQLDNIISVKMDTPLGTVSFKPKKITQIMKQILEKK